MTAGVTAEVLLLNRRLAIEKTRLSARELARTLTVSDRRDSVVPALKKELRDNLHVSKHIEDLTKRYPARAVSFAPWRAARATHAGRGRSA